MSDERGFTLVEMMASLLIFAVMTVGIMPVIAGSLRGSGLSRSNTVAKNVAVDALERLRSLTYFVSYASQQSKVDVLDLYFPAASGAGYVDGAYTTTCTSTTTGDPACALRLPPGHTVRYTAEFVRPSTQGETPTIETYERVAPPSTYAWNSVGNDVPPSRLLRVQAAVTWNFGGTRTFDLTSLIGERQLAELRLRGRGTVDYVVQVQASYSTTDALTGETKKSDLLAIAGSGASKIETRQLSQAHIAPQAGSLRLIRPATDTTAAQDLVSRTGAGALYAAPPDRDPAADVTAVSQLLEHPDLPSTQDDVAFLGPTRATELRVKVANELPLAEARFKMDAGATNLDFWVNNQADTTQDSLLHLDGAVQLFRALANGSNTLTGKTTAVTGPIGGDRKVQSGATATFNEVRLFPTTYIPGSQPRRSAIAISGFSGTVDCKATPSGGATTVAEYGATLQFWDGTAGAFRSVTLSSSNTTDPLQAIKTENPVVYKDATSIDSTNGSALDAHLFPVRHEHVVAGVTVVHDHPGYLRDWASLYAVPTGSGGVTEGGRVAVAQLSGAIRINTVPTNPSISETGLNISIGKMSCEAVDHR